nr:hypothetical protein [Actinospica acidiphila]
MHLRSAHGEPLVDHRAERELVDGAREHPEDEHGAALAAGVDGVTDGGGAVRLEAQLLLGLVVQVHGSVAVGLHADRLDAHVGAASAGAFAQFRRDVGGGVVDGLGADVPLGHLQAFGDAVDGDDAFRAEQDRRPCRHLADGAAAPDGHHVTGLHTAEVRTHPPGGHGVGDEQGAGVVDALGDGEGAVIGEGDAHVFGVAAAQAAHGVGVAEDTGGLVAEQGLPDTGVGVGVVAERPQVVGAVPAAAAADERGDDDPVAHLVPAHRRPGLDDLADELVSDDVAGPHGRDVPADEVQVGAAGGARDEPHDDVLVVAQ